MRATETIAGLALAAFAVVLLVWVIPAEIPRGFSGQLSPRLVPQVAVAGILAADGARRGLAQPRPVDAPWVDRPARFLARRSGERENG